MHKEDMQYSSKLAVYKSHITTCPQTKESNRSAVTPHLSYNMRPSESHDKLVQGVVREVGGEHVQLV